MQYSLRPIPHNRHKLIGTTAGLVLVGAALALLVGCGDAPPTDSTQPKKPFGGQKLTLRCPDAAMADALTPMVKAWATRTGAEISVAREPMTATDDSDIGVIPSAHLGAWAEPGLLLPVPTKLRAHDNPFQWFALLPAYGERLVEWGGQILAVPLTGDGFVVVYRTDRLTDKTVVAEFQRQCHRAPSAPATWEEFADLAVILAAVDKKPSLPPLPNDPERLFDLFCRVASSADRAALNDVQHARVANDRDVLAFQFSTATGQPRLQAPGFQEAAKWLARLRTGGALPPGGPADPAAALADGSASLALLSLDQLDQLARLTREGGAVPARFALVGVPGTHWFFHADKGQVLRDPNANYVPHFSGGRLGVVRSRCQHPEAAFDLLADLGGPARGAEFIATPGLGAGPTRVSHLDRERLTLWLGYGFDNERSKALQDAMRHYTELTVKNPTLGYRGPDRAAVIAAVGGAVREIGAGTVSPADGLNKGEAAWLAVDAKTPAETLIRWRQRAAGLR
jgi:ABC-type glycerol-3-phosphate transport system substrate-binding protein